jgi:hypothetical protein
MRLRLDQQSSTKSKVTNLGLTGTFEPYQKKELSIINLGVAVGRRMEIPNSIKPWA